LYSFLYDYNNDDGDSGGDDDDDDYDDDYDDDDDDDTSKILAVILMYRKHIPIGQSHDDDLVVVIMNDGKEHDAS